MISTAISLKATMDNTSNATKVTPRRHRRSNITHAERHQETVRFSRLRQYTDKLNPALLDALEKEVRREVRAIRSAKNRGMTWQVATQTAYDTMDAISKATSPGEVASTILAISALRRAESRLFLSDICWNQQRCRLLLHLRRDRRRVESTAGTYHGNTREVLQLPQPAIEAFSRLIDRLLERAEVSCGKPAKPKPRPLLDQMLEQQARQQQY